MAYDIWGEVSTTVSGLITPVGHSYTVAKAAGQTGKQFLQTVGKSLIKELTEDLTIGQVSIGAGSLVQNVTGNASLGTLAGVTAGITAGKSSGKALHSVDNAAGGVKSIKQIDNAVSGVKGIDSVTKPNVGGVNESGSISIKSTDLIFGSNTKSAQKLMNQMDSRGWTETLIKDTVDKPYTIRVSTNKATGNSATVLYTKQGSYVIVDDVTKEIVQISDNINPSTWIPDTSIVNPYKLE